MSALPADLPTVPLTDESDESDADLELLGALPWPDNLVAFVRNGDGLAGWGAHARLAVSGPDAAARIASWWHEQSVGLPPGAVVFVSLGFEPEDESVAVIPAVALRHQAGRTTRLVLDDSPAARIAPVKPPGRISWSDTELPVADFTAAVRTATGRIRAGELAKVVLAHGLAARAEHPVDQRFLLSRLARAYPTCFTYAVDGLVGASPEMLVRRTGSAVTSRVLAGTAWPDHAGDAVGDHLLASAKDRAEHAYAVQSVAEALARVTTHLKVPAAPRALALANLTHLATDITGRLGPGGLDALTVAALLHPSAAVGGSPTAVAREVIRELERAPRGRYAAPVGWMDARGDGEFAIALRCGQVTGSSVRLMAGCGIVADSDPATEAREAQIKMIPMRDALEGSSVG